MKMSSKYLKHQGFTMIELLIVIAIIGILATIIIVSYAGAQAKARDNKRKADLQSIASAFQIVYYSTKKWYIPGTGTDGLGNGYFNYQGGSYIKSVANGLSENNYLNPAPRDPLAKSDNDLTNNYTYTVFNSGCASGTSVYAKMENRTDQEIADAKLGCNGNKAVSDYGMTYGVTIKQ